MSSERDLTRIVRSWLEEGVTALPDRVLDQVLDQLPTTPQRRAWWPARRFRAMTLPIRFVTAAAALTIAAVTVIFLTRPSSTVGPPTSPTPTPRLLTAPAGVLEPGRYALDGIFRLGISFTVPAGWEYDGGLESVIDVSKTGRESGEAIVSFWIVSNAFADACDTSTALDPAVGPTALDLATALSNTSNVRATTPTSVSLGGYAGHHQELSRAGECPTGREYQLWTTDSVPGRVDVGQGSGVPRDEVWILDVDGTRLVIDIITYSNTTAQDVAEARAIIESVEIEPLGTRSSPSP